MSKAPTNLLTLPLEERALMALRAAVKKVIKEHARTGHPLYFWKDGKVVEVSAKNLLARSRRKVRRSRRRGKTLKTKPR